MDAMIRAQGGLAAKRWSATCTSGAGPAAASHLQVAAAADEPMAWGSSARGVQHLLGSSHQPLPQAQARSWNQRWSGPWTQGLQHLLGSRHWQLPQRETCSWALRPSMLQLSGAHFSPGACQTRSWSLTSMLWRQPCPQRCRACSSQARRWHSLSPYTHPDAGWGLHTWPPPPHLQASAREVPGMIPAEGDPDFELAHLLPPQAVQGADPLGGWGTPLPDPDAIDWDFTASEHGLSIQGLQEALKAGDGRPVDLLHMQLSVHACCCAGPPIQALCCQQLRPHFRTFPLQVSQLGCAP